MIVWLINMPNMLDNDINLIKYNNIICSESIKYNISFDSGID